MKKTLIALAAVAASTGAMAQSTVSISGLLEISPVSNAKITTQGTPSAASQTNKNSRVGGPNSWSTSVLTISGTEDLGGGLRASFLLMSGAGTQPNSTSNALDTGIGNRQRTLSLAGNFGTVTFGRFIPAAAAGFHAFSGAGSSTLAGSIYGLSQSDNNLNGAFGQNGLHTSAVNFERQNNLIQYTSPTMNGFTVNVAYANNKNDLSGTANQGATSGKQTSLHVGYTAGPLSVGVGINSRKDEKEGTAADIEKADADLQWIGASYDFGVARVFATHATRDDKTSKGAAALTAVTDIKVTGFGVSVPVGAFTLRASTYSGKDKRGTGDTDNMKLSGNQLSVSYALSKRTTVVAAMGKNEYKRDGSASTAATRKVTASTLAVNHTF